MGDNFRISGKRVELPTASSAAGWKFQQRPGGWIIAERELSDGSTERRRFALHESRSRVSTQLGGFSWSGEVSSGSAGGGAGSGGTDSDLIAQFPGKVRKLLVKEGDTVAAGDPLLMVEAMKMEFPVKAPFAGKVTRILVKEAQQLSPGDRFLDLEQSSSENGKGGHGG